MFCSQFDAKMGKNKDLSSELRSQIDVLWKEGLSQRRIASKLKVSQGAVHYALKRILQTGGYRSRPRIGRPRVTTPRTCVLIKRLAVSSPSITSHKIRSRLEYLPVVPSARTIRRRLQSEFGLRAYKPLKKPLLSRKNIKDRLRFATRYSRWTSDDWAKVMFSDESSFAQFRVGRTFVRRPRNERFNLRYVQPVVKHPASVMVWGCISAAGRGGLFFLPPQTTMKAKNYLEMLKEKLPPWMELRGTSIFQHDGAPCHRAKLVKTWLERQAFSELPNWPGSSPDLNVIENCWAVMKTKVAAKSPSSYKELCEAIKEVWTREITQDYCASLVASMPRRIKAVLDARGLTTRY